MWFILVRNWNQVIQSDSILNVDKKWSKNHQGSIYWGGGKLPYPLPPKKFFLKKNWKLFKILMLFDDDIKESVMATNVQKWDFSLSWTLSLQNFPGSMPLNPQEGLKNFFLAAAWLKKFFNIDSSPPPPPPPPNENPDHGDLMCPHRVIAPQMSKKVLT